MHLQDDERDQKIEDFTPDDVFIDPDDPLGPRDLLQVVNPESNHTEGVVEAPKRTTLLWWSQTREQDITGEGDDNVKLFFSLWLQAVNVRLNFYSCQNRPPSPPHTSRRCRQPWTGLPQRKGRRGGQWRLFASELPFQFAAEAGSFGSSWPGETQKYAHLRKHMYTDSIFKSLLLL